MNRKHLQTHIEDYHQKKSWLRQRMPGDKNRFPSVSREMEKLIQFVVLVANEDFSAADISRLKMILSIWPLPDLHTAQAFKKIQQQLETLQAAATAVAEEKPDGDANTVTPAPLADVETSAVVSPLLPATAAGKQWDADSHVDDEDFSSLNGEAGSHPPSENDEDDDADADEYLQTDTEIKTESELVTTTASPAALSVVPVDSFTPSPSSPFVSALLLSPAAGEVKEDSAVLKDATTPLFCGEHLIPPVTPNSSAYTLAQRRRSYGATQASPQDVNAPRRRSISPLWLYAKRAAAVGIAMGVMELATTHQHGVPLSQAALRALSVSLAYSAFSYGVGNHSPLLMMASLVHSAFSHNGSLDAIYASRGTVSMHTLFAGATQFALNWVLPSAPAARGPGFR